MATELKTSVRNGVRTIQFINTKKKNAISLNGYKQITNILNEDALNDKIVVTIFTGKGEYFTSGNDLSSPLSLMAEYTFKEIVHQGWAAFKGMVEAFLNYPKLLITVVNGPAIGIGVTMCSLCDITYASETATFYTPFVELALCIEGCASYLFPRIMGKGKANEVLLLGHKMSAAEALQFNFITRIIPKGEVESFIDGLHELGKLPVKQIISNKRLLTENLRKAMSDCNERECEELLKAQFDKDFLNTITAFMERKSKL